MKISLYKENSKSSAYTKIIFREKAYWDILTLMGSEYAKTKEFMFYGLVEKRVENTFFIEGFKLIPNKANTSVYCESDPDRYIDFMLSNYTAEERKRIRVHAHSHVNMATSPSGTDDKEFLEKANEISDFYIQLIVNHAEKNHLNICDAKNGIKYEEVPQYVQIGDYVFNKDEQKIYAWDEEKCLVGEEAYVPNGNVEIKNNRIIINDSLTYDFNENNFILSGELLEMIPGKSSTYFVPTDGSVEKEIKKQFKDLILPSTTNTKSPSTPDTSYSRSNYFKDIYTDYDYGYYDYKKETKGSEDEKIKNFYLKSLR